MRFLPFVYCTVLVFVLGVTRSYANSFTVNMDDPSLYLPQTSYQPTPDVSFYGYYNGPYSYGTPEYLSSGIAVSAWGDQCNLVPYDPTVSPPRCSGYYGHIGAYLWRADFQDDGKAHEHQFDLGVINTVIASSEYYEVQWTFVNDDDPKACEVIGGDKLLNIIYSPVRPTIGTAFFQPVGGGTLSGVSLKCTGKLLRMEFGTYNSATYATDDHFLLKTATISSDNTPPTLSIPSVRTAQVVYSNPIGNGGSASLVAGKSTSFEVKLNGSNTSGLTGKLVNVVISSNGTQLSKTIQPIDLSTVTESGLVLTADLFSSFVVPAATSVSPTMPLQIQVLQTDGTDLSSLGIANTELDLTLTPVTTYAPIIGTVPIGGCFIAGDSSKPCYNAVTASQLTVDPKVLQFISDVFPFPDNSVTSKSFGTITVGSNNQAQPADGSEPPNGIDEDLANLKLRKTILIDGITTTGPLTRLIGIVGPDYFAYQNYPDARGITVPCEHIAISVPGAPDAFAHEFGHTYCAPDEYEGDASVSVPEGFNARIGGTAGIENNHISVMGASYSAQVQSDYWVNPNIFSTWLSNSTTQDADPKVIYLAATVRTDGTVKVLASGVSETGVVTSSLSGNLQISTLDSSGKILNTVFATSNYQAVIDYVDPTSSRSKQVITLSAAPVAVAIPFSLNAVSIQVSRSGSVLLKQPVTTMALLQILQAIPNSGFKILPSLTRIALTLEISVIQRMIDQKKTSEAIKAIKLLKDEFKIVLKDSYLVSDQELTKMQVLAKLEVIEQTLANR